jgi:hypothetical protein
VELTSELVGNASVVRVLHAQRGSTPEEMPLAEFMARCEAYFASDECIVDQPFQPRVPEGMIRCYMGADKVVGFGHQLIKALIPPPPEGSPAAQPGPRIMHGPDAEPFQVLRASMEAEWTPQMMQVLGIDAASPPVFGTPTFFMDHAPRRAKTPMFCARSMSVRYSQSWTRHRERSRVLHRKGYRAHE